MRASVFATALLVSLCAACGDSSGPANEVTVEMREQCLGNPSSVCHERIFFNPDVLTISAGTVVRWRNTGKFQHNSTSFTAGLWASGDLDSGRSFTRRFDTVGTFAYTCTLHTSMTGTIIVE